MHDPLPDQAQYRLAVGWKSNEGGWQQILDILLVPALDLRYGIYKSLIHMDKVPQEIKNEILNYACNNVTDAANCALVDRTFRWQAQEALFRILNISGSSKSTLLRNYSWSRDVTLWYPSVEKTLRKLLQFLTVQSHIQVRQNNFRAILKPNADASEYPMHRRRTQESSMRKLCSLRFQELRVLWISVSHPVDLQNVNMILCSATELTTLEVKFCLHAYKPRRRVAAPKLDLQGLYKLLNFTFTGNISALQFVQRALDVSSRSFPSLHIGYFENFRRD
ncbi:hypothetical protein EV421DRAFT_1737795 [Armillaria borealis]|uniref:Uncharacterized protein n=1 Tax=Armillaria borealis TaxID=47425 RepID=A0AA39JC57_9AGAR|nr:hypothetical protein EV421DRAFT_1737795 [Armillaria borealis]